MIKKYRIYECNKHIHTHAYFFLFINFDRYLDNSTISIIYYFNNSHYAKAYLISIKILYLKVNIELEERHNC